MSSPSPPVLGGDTSLGGRKKSPSLPPPKSKPWYAKRQFWKQFSVTFSIFLSAASLILGAVGEFQILRSDIQRGLNVTGLVVNAISVILSALTSLDWKSAAQIEADLLHRLDSLLVQQPVLAETPSTPSDAGTDASAQPKTHTIHVLSLQSPHIKGGSGGGAAPLLSGGGGGAKKRKPLAAARSSGPGNDNDGSKMSMKRRVFRVVSGSGRVKGGGGSGGSV